MGKEACWPVLQVALHRGLIQHRLIQPQASKMPRVPYLVHIQIVLYLQECSPVPAACPLGSVGGARLSTPPLL